MRLLNYWTLIFWMQINILRRALTWLNRNGDIAIRLILLSSNYGIGRHEIFLRYLHLLSFMDCCAFFYNSFRWCYEALVLRLFRIFFLRFLALNLNLILWYWWFIFLRWLFYFFFLDNLTFNLSRQKSLVPALIYGLLLFDLLSLILTLFFLLRDFFTRHYLFLSFFELLITLVYLFLCFWYQFFILLLLLYILNKLLNLFHPTGWTSFAFLPNTLSDFGFELKCKTRHLLAVSQRIATLLDLLSLFTPQFLTVATLRGWEQGTQSGSALNRFLCAHLRSTSLR